MHLSSQNNTHITNIHYGKLWEIVTENYSINRRCKNKSFVVVVVVVVVVVIIIIIIIINCKCVITRWQWLFYMYKNMKIKVTRKFKSGGLHERHVAASWKPTQHSLVDTGKSRKTCVEVVGRRTFQILTSSQQSGI